MESLLYEAEALVRIGLLKLHPDIWSKWKIERKPVLMEDGEIIEDKLDYLEAIEDALPYLIIRTGCMDSVLCVGDRDEWEVEREELRDGKAVAYVFDHEEPEMSEWGFIRFERTDKGTLVRTA